MKIHPAKPARLFAVCMAAAAFVLTTGQRSGNETAFAEGPGIQTCHGVRIAITGMQRSGPGDITAQFQITNTNNDDMAMFVYYGGSNGRNTFLMDNTGAEWPKKRIDGNGNHRQALMARTPTNYSLTFHIPAGGDNAHQFQLIEWVQLLPLTGMGEVGWCKYQFPNLPL